VHAQFLLVEWCRKKEVAGIEGVIAVVFPGRTMELVGAGLDGHGDGSRSSHAIFSAIVGSQLSELRNGFAGRSSGYTTPATVVVVLTAVHHESVMGSALAIEADIGIAADRDILVIGDVVRCAGSQRSQLK